MTLQDTTEIRAQTRESDAKRRQRDAAARALTHGDAAGTSDGEPAISIRNLSKTYPVPLARLKSFFRRKARAAPVEALHDVSLDVREGEVFGLIGRNGAGKTTLLKIIATLVQPSSGSVAVRGFDSVREETDVRAQIGLASAEERSFYWRLTVERNLMFFARLYGLGVRAARARVAEMCERLELDARKRFGELSTGNKQRMAMARAMLNSPPVLLLDEPTRSLDPVAAARMRSLISSLASGTPPVTILLTSHNLAEIEELSNRVAVISGGSIRATGAPAELRTLNRQQERVRLTVGGIAEDRISSLLRDELGEFDLTSEQSQTVVVSFARVAGDERLDRCLRALIADGASVLACDTERATLLDVLEIYEREAGDDETKATRSQT